MLRVQGRSGAPEGVPAGSSRRNAKRTQELGAAAARCRHGPNEVMRSRFRVRRRAGVPARRRPRIPSRFTISNTAPPRRLRHAQGRQGPPRRASSARERCYRRGRGAESTGCAKKMREIGKKFVWGCWLCCIKGLGGCGALGGRRWGAAAGWRGSPYRGAADDAGVDAGAPGAGSPRAAGILCACPSLPTPAPRANVRAGRPRTQEVRCGLSGGIGRGGDVRAGSPRSRTRLRRGAACRRGGAGRIGCGATGIGVRGRAGAGFSKGLCRWRMGV